MAEACLQCADQLLAANQHAAAASLYTPLSGAGETEAVRMAAWRGLVRAQPEQSVGLICAALCSGDPLRENMALQLVPQVPGSSATTQFAECLGKASPPLQTLLLGALAVRRDATARSAVEAAAAGNEATVRIAALKALGELGDESTAKLLVGKLTADAGTPEADAARSSLLRLRGPRINAVLTEQLAAGAKPELIRLLAARRAASATAALARTAAAEDENVRQESWKALGALAAAQDVPALLDLLVRAAPSDREEAEKAVAAVVSRTDRPDVAAVLQRLEHTPVPAAQASLIRIASAVGDERALPALCKLIQFREPQEVAAIHLLWHPHEGYRAKNFDILCDDKVVAEVRKLECVENERFIPLKPVRCTTVELVIPGKNGLVSPCIHELEIFGPFLPVQAVGSVPKTPRYRWKQADTTLALLRHDRVVCYRR